MGGDSLLLPVRRSVGGEFTGKGESEVWVDCSRLNLGKQGEHLTCWLTWLAGESIERIVYRSGGGGGSIVYRNGGGGLYRSG